MIGRPRTWSDSPGFRGFTWGRFYLDTSPASPRRWRVRRHRLGWEVQAGGRVASVGRHTALVSLLLAAVVALVAGCGGSTPLASSSQVCVTAFGHIRVDDFRCTGPSMAYDWWYLTPGLVAPAIGQRATVGSLTRPKGSVRSGLPAMPTTTTTTRAKPKPATTTAKKKQDVKPKTAKPAAPKPKPAAPKVRTR